ncbi:MAG: AI-2E family transporter [Lachnospiraceae bacterium]
MTDKQKRLFQLLGITGAIYLSFKYVVPLVLPFLLAVLVAKMVESAASRLRRIFPVGRVTAAILILLVGGGLMGWGLYWIGCQLFSQIKNLIEMWPSYETQIGTWMGCACQEMEHWMHLQHGSISRMVNEFGSGIKEQLPEITVPYMAECSANLLGKLGMLGAILAVFLLSVLFYIRDKDTYIKWKNQSMFQEDFDYFAGHLGRIGRAYLRTEGILMILTACICSIGLYLIGNEYSILLGILIGFVDALPLFGTGTIFIPWIVAEIIFGEWKLSFKLFGLYLVCYFMRQMLEPRLLGQKLGITPLEVVASVYIGLKLFGFGGLFLGPIAWILWKEIDKKYFLT